MSQAALILASVFAMWKIAEPPVEKTDLRKKKLSKLSEEGSTAERHASDVLNISKEGAAKPKKRTKLTIVETNSNEVS